MVDAKINCGENDDDSAEVADPQYELFLEMLTKHKKSYVLKGKINDVSVHVKYEEKRKFGRRRNPKCVRKMRKDVGRADVATHQSPRLPNEREPVNQHESDNVNDRRDEISKNPDLRNKELIKQSDVGFSKTLSERMDNLGSGKVSKDTTSVHKNNIVTDNQSEPYGQALLRNSDKGKNVAKAHHEPSSISLIRVGCDGNRYQSPDPINNSESKNHVDPVGQAQLIMSKEDLIGKNVVLSKHNSDTENHLCLKPDPTHNLASKCQVDHDDQVVPNVEAKEVQIKKNLPKLKDERNVVMDDCVANKKTLNYIDNEPLCLKPSPEKNLQEHRHDEADQSQPGKQNKVQIQRKLRKVVHGSYEIKVDDKASRNDMAQIENNSLFHKPCPRKYQVTRDCIDQACPEQSHSMFMKEIIDIRDDSDSDIEILDSATFNRAGNPGLFVTSKKFHKSVIEDDDAKLLGSTSLPFDFRRQIMKVLQKPYDRLESIRLQEAFMAGSFFKFHPGLVKIFAIYRHQSGNFLAILRGFFFWLENLTQEGSFKPWEDKECLSVDTTLF